MAEQFRTPGAPGDTDAERAAWLADKIAAGGDYAKEAAAMLRRWPDGVDASEDDFKTAVLRCRYPVCKTLHPSGWGWDTSRLNEVIADHAGVLGTDGGQR